MLTSSVLCQALFTVLITYLSGTIDFNEFLQMMTAKMVSAHIIMDTFTPVCLPKVTTYPCFQAVLPQVFNCLCFLLASFPGSCVGEEEREPGTHCLRMRQVSLVTCILLRCTKITVNKNLGWEKPENAWELSYICHSTDSHWWTDNSYLFAHNECHNLCLCETNTSAMNDAVELGQRPIAMQ